MLAGPRRKLTLLLAGIVAGAAIAPGVGLAAKFLTPKKANRTFVSNMSAERGQSGSLCAGCAPHTSDVTINATTDGFLLIQGSAHFTNMADKGQDEAQLSIRVDGGAVVPAGSATLGPNSSPDLDPGETAQVAYVDVVPVGKGSHTVRQLLSVQEGGGSGCPPDVTGCGISINFSEASLVVTFFPAKGVSLG